MDIDHNENEKTGEQRYSVEMSDGSKWILTVAGKNGGWQNAHFHKGLWETYVIQSGFIAFAEDTGQNMSVDYHCIGDVVSSVVNKAHNVWMSPGAVIHTVKAGEPVGNPDKKGNDWWPAPALDAWSKSLADEAAIDAYLESLRV